jgi:hypothetical protein
MLNSRGDGNSTFRMEIDICTGSLEIPFASLLSRRSTSQAV